jgi:hypothetical protein
MAGRTRRTPKKPEDWDAFLDALNRSRGDVSHAADAIGIHRQRAYEHRQHDQEFAQRWEAIVDRATDEMEAEARRRAVEGCEKPIFYKGEAVGTVREYSDTLLIFLLKARRPHVYRENHRVEHVGASGGPVNVRVELDEEQRKALSDVLRGRPATRSD